MLGVHDDRAEGLVDLDEVEVGCLKALPLERLSDRARRLCVERVVGAGDLTGGSDDREHGPPALVGVRALIHDQPDPLLLDRPEVRRTLALLAERGLPLDVPDAWPHQLAAATRAAR